MTGEGGTAITQRDSKNVDRYWRIWKARHLVQTPGLLSRLLGRKVA